MSEYGKPSADYTYNEVRVFDANGNCATQALVDLLSGDGEIAINNALPMPRSLELPYLPNISALYVAATVFREMDDGQRKECDRRIRETREGTASFLRHTDKLDLPELDMSQYIGVVSDSPRQFFGKGIRTLRDYGEVALENYIRYGFFIGHHWRQMNWGCDSDLYCVHLTTDKDGVLTIDAKTTGGRPKTAMKAISSMLPGCRIEMACVTPSKTLYKFAFENGEIVDEQAIDGITINTQRLIAACRKMKEDKEQADIED